MTAEPIKSYTVPMIARPRNKAKKSGSEAPNINPKVIFFMLVVVVCCVFVWGYYTNNAKNANASSPENQKTVITRPADAEGNP